MNNETAKSYYGVVRREDGGKINGTALTHLESSKFPTKKLAENWVAAMVSEQSWWHRGPMIVGEVRPSKMPTDYTPDEIKSLLS